MLWSPTVNALIRVAEVFLLAAALVSQVSAQDLQRLQLGGAVYEASCAPCHGQLYDPGGPLGPESGAIPAFYAGSRYLLRLSPANISAAILLGVAGTGMSGLGGELSDEQLDALIAYIEWFRCRPGQRPW